MKRSMLYGLIGTVVAVLMLLAFVIYSQVVKPLISLRNSVVLQGPSMEPSFKEGDLLRTKPVTPEALQRGAVVVVDDPAKPGRILVKRIIALGGDQVELRKGVVYLNGARVDEPYIAGTGFPGGDVAPVAVPPDHIYLLGDNRGASFDSRQFGPVPAEKVKAIVVTDN